VEFADLNRIADGSPGDSDREGRPMILPLAIKSLRNRRLTAGLTVLSIALAVALLLGVERIRQESRETFANSVSGTDLIVGARTSPVNLLLSSVFRIGNATNNMRWESYRRIAALRKSPGRFPFRWVTRTADSMCLARRRDYFDHFRFGQDRKLELVEGERFADASGTVLGADVAAALGYRVGQQIVIAHGSGDVAFALHKDHPFAWSGYSRAPEPLSIARFTSRWKAWTRCTRRNRRKTAPIRWRLQCATRSSARCKAPAGMTMTMIMASSALARTGARRVRSPQSSSGSKRATRRCSCSDR
jgi:putative ABC transport system permease protein